MKYIYQNKDWPHFKWNTEKLANTLALVRHRQGRLIGRMESLGLHVRDEACLNTLTEDVLKTSDIEGEKLDKDQVRSSLARRLGIKVAGLVQTDRSVDGIVEMMLDATQNYTKPLTQDRLFNWHSSLFRNGSNNIARIIVGKWRDDLSGRIQVVSGPIGKEQVHYQAPKASKIPSEIDHFLNWFESEKETDLVLKAGLAHLWFLTIHPFDDGNGRIGRAIADLALARSEQCSQRFYSLSSQIRIERRHYYNLLEATQKGNLDVTSWLLWFIECLGRALDGAETTMGAVIVKARFWHKLEGQILNERQNKMLNLLFDGFEGNLTSSKWAKIMKCSQDTASRDIEDLVQRKILERSLAGGRSTNYWISQDYL